MPILLPTAQLQPGMRLDEPIVQGGRVMLPDGKELSETDVQIITRRFPELWVRTVHPAIDEFLEFEDDTHEREVAANIRKKIAGTISQVQEQFARRGDMSNVDFPAMQETAAEAMAYLKDNPVTAALLGRDLDADLYLGEHTGNVFFLSVVLGTAVQGYVAQQRRKQSAATNLSSQVVMDLKSLGLGAMFMDLGMVPLQQFFKKNEPLNEQERELLLQHPIAGADLLPDNVGGATKMTVRTHHENSDGSGYPKGLKREKLHVFTRIIRIADSYDAATARHVYKQAKSPARALWEMSAGPMQRFYDPILIKVLMRLIQPFPIGAKLRLTDGRYAVVVRYNRTNPFSPVVAVAFDANDRPLPHDRIEGPLAMDEHPELRIRSFADEDLSFIYETPTNLAEVPDRGEISSMFDAAVP